MKHHTHCLLALTMATTMICSQNKDTFTITLEPLWQNLEQDAYKSKQFGGKWILAGSITFRKKAKESVNLSKINLRWKGEPINHLFSSLYKKNLNKEFLPIQDQLICDSLWNKKKQTLMFTFEKQQTLGPVAIFYLVLTVPDELENILKRGEFEIEETYLPDEFRTHLNKQTLSLNLESIAHKTSA